VRAVDRGSVEAGAAEEGEGKSRLFAVRCSSEVRGKLSFARGAAARVAGRMLHLSEAAELVAAEVLSALPVEEEKEACEEAGVSWSGASEAARDEAVRPPWRAGGAGRDLPRLPSRRGPGPGSPADGATPFPGGAVGADGVPALAGAGADERAPSSGMRALVRLERTAALNNTFARAWRTGALPWMKASLLVPLVRVDPLGGSLGEWVEWAGRVTARRLEEDVERAVLLAETDPAAFRQGGGLPPEARDGDDRGIGAHPRTPQETCWARFIGPPDVVQLFKAVHCTVRRRMERQTGKLPTAGEALGAMLDHALSTWGALDDKVAARHRIFARDGWRCAAPGCSSMQNLHDHHIRFRSAQGGNALENRITLCAFHHLRGVHAGLLRCGGRAPDGLRWEMGIRPDRPPRLAYRSGDIRVGARNSSLRRVERPGTAAAPSPAPA
jgi:hypothetical protein